MRETDNYVFFFGKADVFSNWHQASFDFRGVRFNCVEQFMMYSKAMLFGDQAVAANILATNDPKTQKALGRTVKGFDSTVWDAKCMSIVTVGCREKFRQNPSLLSALLATGDKVLVEASPYDKIWGIGLGENDPAAVHPEQWKGKNLLGKALVAAREVLVTSLNKQTLADHWNATPATDTCIGSIKALSNTEVIQHSGQGNYVVWNREDLSGECLEINQCVTIQKDGKVICPDHNRPRIR